MSSISATEMIRFSSGLRTKSTDARTIPAVEYETECIKNKNCFEYIPDDVPVKLYFDIDIKGDVNEYNDELDHTENIINESNNVIIELIQMLYKMPDEPILSVSTSCSESFIDCATKSLMWKISVHIVVQNCIALKSIQRFNIEIINNAMAKGLTPSYRLFKGNNWFDTSIYDRNRKMRSVHCSKPGENRPLLIEEGTFEQSVISAFIPENAFILRQEMIKKRETETVVSTPYVSENTSNDNIYNTHYINRAIELGALNKRASDRQEWLNTGFELLTSFGSIEGRELFHKFSQCDPSKYDSDEVNEKWDEISVAPQCGKLRTMGSMKYYMDKNYPEIHKTINVELVALRKEHKKDTTVLPTDKSDDDMRFVQDDNAAAIMLMESLKDILIPSKRGRLFLKQEHIWHCDSEKVNEYLLSEILNSNICKKNDGNKYVPYAQNVKTAKNVREAIIVKIRTQPGIVDIYQKLHTTTKNRLAFKDGVLDFIKRRFYKWDDVDFEFYTTVIIDYDYADYFANPDLTVISTVKNKIFNSLFAEDTTKALNFFSRGIAGCFEDKNWATYLGNRDCGKGVLYDALKSTFQDYVQTFELGNILYERSTNTEEVSRKLYWLFDLEFVRLGISQETPAPETKLKANGKLIKKLAGGGDTHVVKRNYDRIDSHITIDTTFLFMGNNALIVDVKDTMEHCIEFSSTNQFKSQADIDELRANGEDELLISAYTLQDTTIKSLCKTDEWKKALVYLIYTNYITTAVPIIQHGDTDDNNISVRRQLLSLYTITRSNTDIVLATDLYNSMNDCKKKINNELTSMGIIRKKDRNNQKQSFYGLVLKEVIDIN
jgi:hypothetical protein